MRTKPNQNIYEKAPTKALYTGYDTSAWVNYHLKCAAEGGMFGEMEKLIEQYKQILNLHD